MKNTVSIGLVGCGEWGKHILRDLCTLGCEVAVVCRSAVSWKRAIDGGAASIVKYLSDLPPVQGVVVATPTSTHFDVTQELLDRKIPIFVEKPITNSTEQVLALVSH